MKFKKLFSALMVGGALFACGCDDSYSHCSADAMSDLKAAYIASPSDNRTLESGLNLFGPYFQANVGGKVCVVKDGTFAWDGKLDWIFTDKNNNNTQNESIPMYIEQHSNMLTLYAYRNGAWNKLSLPAIPVGLIAAVKSDDTNVLANNLSAVKSAEVVAEQANTKKIRVVLDGKKLAGIVAANSQNAQGEQAVIMNRLKTALNSTDITAEWDYNKEKNQTVTLSVNLTPVVRAYAKGVIDEMAAGKIKLSDEDKNYYAALGYYAEAPFYMSTVGAVGKNEIMTPSGLNGARENSAVFADLKKEIATTPDK